ncbi:MAG: phosphoglycolate phosphatase [Paracoccaceae bacterium]
MVTSLIFDLDGTLVDSAPEIHAGVLDLLAEEGLPPLSFDTVRGFIGGGVPTLITRVMRALALPEDPARHRALCARFERRYEDSPEDLTRPYPGVEAALDALDLPLALCTNKPEGPTRALIARLGWVHRFPVLVCGDSLPSRKPDPAMLHHAIAAMGGGPALFVGDSEVDAETAARAGQPLLLYTQGYRKTALADLPHLAAFDHWDDLPALIRRCRDGETPA